MPSNINPTNIDGSYPIAGQDNDSQGFRDNFTNIRTNLQYSKMEIEDLQNKAILKAGLQGTVLNNDMNYAVLYRPQMKATIESFREFPGTQTGSVTVSFLDSLVQRIETTGPLIINLTDFPAAGNWGSVKVWIRVRFAPGQSFVDVKLPETVTMGINRLANFNVSSRFITFTSPGDYLYEFSSADAGTSYWVNQIG